LNVKLWRDLEAWVRGRSKSLKMVLFESLDTVYYLHSVVTMAVSCIISEIKWGICRTSRFFHTLFIWCPS